MPFERPNPESGVPHESPASRRTPHSFPLCRLVQRRVGSRRVRTCRGLAVQEGSEVAADSPYREGFFDCPGNRRQPARQE